MNGRMICTIGTAVLMCLVGVVNADGKAGQDLEATVKALQARVAELEGKQDGQWLNEKRTAEVKGLVREVLQDADTRASLLGAGPVAGHKGGQFFLGSEDGNFELRISGYVQASYIANFRKDSGDDDGVAGFNVHRANIDLAGNVVSPKWMYALGLQVGSHESVYLNYAKIGYKAMDSLTIWIGESKAPMLREELVADTHGLAFERSLVNEVFTAGAVQGVFAEWAPHDMVKVAVAITDGWRSGEAGSDKEFNQDSSDFTAGARVDVKLMGTWAQYNSFNSVSEDEMALFVGAAGSWQVFESGSGTAAALSGSAIQWTVDATMKFKGLAAFAAATGVHTQDTAVETNNYGIVGQVSYLLPIEYKIEPFIRYEFIDIDNDHAGVADVNLFTAGVNYYIKGHAAKCTLDVVWAANPLTTASVSNGTVGPASMTLLGLQTDAATKKNQVAIRAMFQLAF